MKNKIILIVSVFLTSLGTKAHTGEGVAADINDNMVIYLALATIALLTIAGLIAVYSHLSKQIKIQKGSISSLKENIGDESTKRKVEELEERLKEVDKRQKESQLPAPPTVKKEEETQQSEAKREYQNEIFYANYRPQDKCFKLSSTQNDGWMIWKIVKLSPTEATYELDTDVSPSHYGEQWNKIKEMVRCAVAPSGTISSARTIKSGRLQNVDGVWRVDPEKTAEIEFVCT